MRRLGTLRRSSSSSRYSVYLLYSFTCFTSISRYSVYLLYSVTYFTSMMRRFTSTKVRILTPEELQQAAGGPGLWDFALQVFERGERERERERERGRERESARACIYIEYDVLVLRVCV